VLCELVPGGVPGEITAGQAAHIPASITPADAVAAARCELAAEFHRGPARHRRSDPRHQADARPRGRCGRDQPDRAIRGRPGHRRRGHRRRRHGVPLCEPGSLRRLQRHRADRGIVGPGQDLPAVRRGNRRHGHAIHTVAVTQIRHRHSQGRAYHEKNRPRPRPARKRCALKRQISDAIFACLQAGARRAAAAAAKSPGGQPGNGSASSAAGSHPGHRLIGQATPGPATQPTTPAGAGTPAPFPRRCQPARADNARGGKAGTLQAGTCPAERRPADLHRISTVRLTAKQRGVRHVRCARVAAWPQQRSRTGNSVSAAGSAEV